MCSFVHSFIYFLKRVLSAFYVPGTQALVIAINETVANVKKNIAFAHISPSLVTLWG